MIYQKQSARIGEDVARRIIKRRSWYLILFGALLAGIAGGQDILMTYGVAGVLLLGSLKKPDQKIVKRIAISTSIYAVYLPVLWVGILRGIGVYGLPGSCSGDETYFGTLAGQIIAVPIIPLFNHLMFPIIPAVYMGIWLGRKNALIQADQNVGL